MTKFLVVLETFEGDLLNFSDLFATRKEAKAKVKELQEFAKPGENLTVEVFSE